MSKASAFQMASGTSATPAPAVQAVPIQPGIVEAPQVQQPVQTPDELTSSRLAILAKKEAQIVKDREAYKREREETLKQRSEADQILAKAREFEQTRLKDPVAALKMLGFSETEIFNYMAQAEKTEPTTEDIARRISQEETQKVRDDLQKQKDDDLRVENDRLITNLRNDISSSITKNAEKFEYCAFEPDAEAQVYEIIVENLKANKELLSVEQALEIAEEFYYEKDKAAQNLKKRQALFKPAEGVIVESQAKTTPAEKPKPAASRSPTLTNRVTATAASLSSPARETASQKKERLAEVLRRGHF